jgi:hypothetical protein
MMVDLNFPIRYLSDLFFSDELTKLVRIISGVVTALNI